MKHLQINVVQPKLLQAGLERTWDVGDVGKNLSGHEEFLAVHTRLADRGTELGLRLVDLSTV